MPSPSQLQCWASYGGAPPIPQRRRRRISVDKEDMLVAADLAGVAADQLVGKVGIDALRVEQLDAIFQLRTLDVERRKLDLPLFMQPRIIAPGEKPIGAEQRIAGEIGDHENSQRRRDRRAQDVDNRSWS